MKWPMQPDGAGAGFKPAWRSQNFHQEVNFMKRRRMALGNVVFLVSFVIAFSTLSWGAEKFPARPLEMINPFGPGGFNDVHCQLLTTLAQQYLGQPLVMTMKPGAGGVVGSAFVARAKPDGYTLLMAGPGPNSISCQIENTGYTKESFIPIMKINHAPAVIAVKATKPWKTLEDLLKYIRQDPKKVIYGTTSVTGVTTLGNYLLLQQAGIQTQLATVPYKGVGDHILSVLKGDTDYMSQVFTGLVPYIKSKELRVLAVLDEKRLSLCPDVPTAKELGFDVSSIWWGAVLAPRGTPAEVVDTLAAGFGKMVRDPQFAATMQKMEMPFYPQDRSNFQKYWDQEYQKFGELITRFNLKKK